MTATDPRPWWVALRDLIDPPLPASDPAPDRVSTNRIVQDCPGAELDTAPEIECRRAPSHGIPVTQPAALDQPSDPPPISVALKDARRHMDQPLGTDLPFLDAYRDDTTAACARRLIGIGRADVGLYGAEALT